MKTLYESIIEESLYSKWSKFRKKFNSKLNIFEKWYEKFENVQSFLTDIRNRGIPSLSELKYNFKHKIQHYTTKKLIEVFTLFKRTMESNLKSGDLDYETIKQKQEDKYYEDPEDAMTELLDNQITNNSYDMLIQSFADEHPEIDDDLIEMIKQAFYKID